MKNKHKSTVHTPLDKLIYNLVVRKPGDEADIEYMLETLIFLAVKVKHLEADLKKAVSEIEHKGCWGTVSI